MSDDNQTHSLLDRLSIGARWAAMAILLVITVVTGWQVFARFVLNDTPPWSEQLATSLMVWIALLGGAVVAREDRHIALTYFVDRMPTTIRKLVQFGIQVLILAFSIMMVWYGTEMSLIVKNWSIPTLGLSRAFDYIAFPAAGALITLFAAAQIVARIRGTVEDPPPHTVDPGHDPEDTDLYDDKNNNGETPS